MIHFRCECGRTLSAGDESAGGTIRCESCGVEQFVPTASRILAGQPRTRPSTGSHDFDAEIVGASRTLPPRPVRTPGTRSRVAEPEEDPGGVPPGAKGPPSFDLLRVSAAVGRLAPVAAGALVFGVGGAAAAAFLLPGGILLRGAIALALLSTGAGACAALLALREVGRTVLGLAERQRELTELIEEPPEPSPGPPGG